ncbi:MAG: hypothetical protein ACLPXM_20945 [Terriglobales bacterium]
MSGIKRTGEEIAKIIDGFLDGTCGKWDWDDLCSIKIEDPELDHVRVLCSSACFTYPPTERGHYCSSQGREYLRELARKLSEGQRPVA